MDSSNVEYLLNQIKGELSRIALALEKLAKGCINEQAKGEKPKEPSKPPQTKRSSRF